MIFPTLNATHGIAKAFLSVCLSVCLSVKHVLCEKFAHILIPHERAFILVSDKKNGWWGATSSI